MISVSTNLIQYPLFDEVTLPVSDMTDTQSIDIELRQEAFRIAFLEKPYLYGLYLARLLETPDFLYAYDESSIRGAALALTNSLLLTANNVDWLYDYYNGIVDFLNFNYKFTKQELLDAHNQSQIHTMYEAILIAKRQKRDVPGSKIGLMHGHYRILTPANILATVVARSRCDFLYLGVETAETTYNYKGATPLLDDWIRYGILSSAGVAHEVFEVDHCYYPYAGAYTNAFYKCLCDEFPMTYYFHSGVQSPVSKEVIFRQRLGMDYKAINERQYDWIVLPRILGPSTTDLYNRYGKSYSRS